LLVVSGGLSAKADRDYVAKNINLAQKITDGGKIYIPFAGETIPPVNNATGNTQASGALININTASEQELDSLPGIGPVTAAKIINSRPYGSVNELLDKKIVGSKVFTDIKNKISVY
jgi:competence protein ComEA